MNKTAITLVTGASGFIGGRIVEVLHLTGHRRVRAAIRQWSSAARLGRLPVDIVLMDLLKTEEIDKALDGVTEIIHCAKGPQGVTVNGTRNLLAAALKKNIKRFVHLSTTEVYGAVEGEIDETAPFQYTGNEYNRTKIDAEKVCWEFHEKGLPLTILRPSIVYGPFSKNWSVRFAEMMLAGEWGIMEGYGEGKCNLIFVDDLVRTIISVLNHPQTIGKRFNVNGPDIISWNEYFIRYNKSLNLGELKIIKKGKSGYKRILLTPVRFTGKIVQQYFMESVKSITNQFSFIKRIMLKTIHELKTTPVMDELKLFNRKVYFKSGAIENILNQKPIFDLDGGLELTKNWLKASGYYK